ncbi:hypothetical protein PTD2_10579 [Pseudoalteromonas tunicata D2]|uniref:Uncharacterized protein n=1 Tax=Pseudoalteromonas tunicata D2 TaxID=87626 RepID=A4C5K0_9GAMM|nr:hypothetical protein PTD2_10579 [Pseudoalteromonas tunicata D2]
MKTKQPLTGGCFFGAKFKTTIGDLFLI